jgi:hypothetical protein
MGRVIIEEASGVTEQSLRIFKTNKDILKGKVNVIVRHDPGATDWYRTTISDSEGNVIELSGFSIGYPGEGPRGLELVLKELKLPFDFKRDIETMRLPKCRSSVHVFTEQGPKHFCVAEEWRETEH